MQFDVVNSENKKVGTRRRPRRGVRRAREHRPDLGIGRARERGGAPRHARDQEPRARQRQRQEAVAAEGHRPRARRLRSATRCGGTAARCSARSRAATTSSCRRRSRRGALRAALAQKMKDGALVVVDALTARDDQDEGGGRDAEAAGRRPARRCSIDVALGREAGAVGAQHRRRRRSCRARRVTRARRDERATASWRRAARSRSCRRRSA